jgi:hypothetical protein
MRTVPQGVQAVNSFDPQPDFFASPNCPQRIIPLHVAHDLALYHAMARDGWPVVCIPPDQVGVATVMAALASEPRRPRPSEQDVYWLTPEPGRAEAVEARARFDDANFAGTGQFFSSCEVQTGGLDDYEENRAPAAAADLEEWAAEIEEGRREEQEQKERDARESAARRAARAEAEEAEVRQPGAIYTSPGWESHRAPLHVTSDRATAEAIAGAGYRVVRIPQTLAGRRALVALIAGTEIGHLGDPRRHVVWVTENPTDRGELWNFQYDTDPFVGERLALHAGDYDPERVAVTVAPHWIRGTDYWKLELLPSFLNVDTEPPEPNGDLPCLRPTPRDYWHRAQLEIFVGDDEYDAFTDEQIEDYHARLDALGPIPAAARGDVMWQPSDPSGEAAGAPPAPPANNPHRLAREYLIRPRATCSSSRPAAATSSRSWPGWATGSPCTCGDWRRARSLSPRRATQVWSPPQRSWR